MNFGDIKTSVEENLDGRSLAEAKHQRWIKRVRDRVAMNFPVAGFKGLYFLYKEATVSGGSVADQSKYAIPSDYIDDLRVFYDNNLLTPAGGLLDITQDLTASGTPKWIQMKGNEFEIIPAPDTASKEIKLLYNGLPSTISSDNDEDYFMKHFSDLHINGMSELGAKYLRDFQSAQQFKMDYLDDLKLLQLHNRRFYLKNARIRFHTWDEYEEAKKNFVFPQFQET
jgi:hypothetical protein